MDEKLETLVQQLRYDEERYQRYLRLSGTVAGGSFCTCDHFFWFIVRRSKAITSTFADLMEQRNHFVAPALVRLQMSSLLGIQAGRCHEKGLHECVEEWMLGKAFPSMKDDRGKPMSDGNLLKRLAEQITNSIGEISILYGVASGWVHLDPKFFYATLQHIGDDGEVSFLLDAPEHKIPSLGTEDEINWTVNMISINNLIIANLMRWTACKQEQWGHFKWTGDETTISGIRINPQEIIVQVENLEAILVAQDDAQENEKFVLWLNDTGPFRNVAFAKFATKEQAGHFATEYINHYLETKAASSEWKPEGTAP